MSAIDWLSRPPEKVALPVPMPEPVRIEPPVARSGHAPEVRVAPLTNGAPRRLGLLPEAITGLPADLWNPSDIKTLRHDLQAVGAPTLPAAQALLLTLLMAEADPLSDPRAASAWLQTRIDRLAELGAVEEARALALQAGPRRAPGVFSRWLGLSLLTGTENAPCGVLIAQPTLSRDVATNVYCRAQQGDFDTAALLLGSSAALGLIEAPQEALLSRFLDPELFGPETLPARTAPDPLAFRLFEAAGAPLATTSLPRAYAHADLRSEAGWKQQLDAAERLTRAGALPVQRLLTLYDGRRPAASGGVWDRVRAYQRLDAAIAANDTTKIAAELTEFWSQFQGSGLLSALAKPLAPRLAGLDLGAAAPLAVNLQLLTSDFAKAPATGFLQSLAAGTPDPALAHSNTQTAIAGAFAAPVTKPDGPLGPTLLRLLHLLEQGADGSPDALRRALTGLRGAGQETFAIRAALQILILKT